MTIIQAHVFEVEKTQLQNTRISSLNIKQTTVDNEVIFKVDKFALTANNITYGIAGNTLGYWRFFPTEDATNNILEKNTLTEGLWGRLPVMGYAEVITSNCTQVSVGERVWGFMPMASHFKIIAGKISANGFSDISDHRAGLSPLYATFDRISTNPFYLQKNEDFEILVRGLFTTSWLIDDFMFDNQYFDAQQYLITSASSKTSIALAFAIKERRERSAIGITSATNKSFVEAIGCYDQVVSYEEIATLEASIASILVDMAGSQTALTAIHQHFNDQLRYSCRVGLTHHEDLISDNITDNNQLPGARPTFFFAPTQLQKRMAEWGSRETMAQISAALLRYIEFCRSIMTINHTTTTKEITLVYQSILSGTADASVGQVLSMS